MAYILHRQPTSYRGGLPILLSPLSLSPISNQTWDAAACPYRSYPVHLQIQLLVPLIYCTNDVQPVLGAFISTEGSVYTMTRSTICRNIAKHVALNRHNEHTHCLILSIRDVRSYIRTTHVVLFCIIIRVISIARCSKRVRLALRALDFLSTFLGAAESALARLGGLSV